MKTRELDKVGEFTTQPWKSHSITSVMDTCSLGFTRRKDKTHLLKEKGQGHIVRKKKCIDGRDFSSLEKNNTICFSITFGKMKNINTLIILCFVACVKI